MARRARDGWLVPMLIGAALQAGGCGGGGGGGGHGGGGGGGGGSPPVAVTVATAGNQTVVRADATLQVSAAVSNAANPNVTWTLSGTGCPGSGCGTLSSTTSDPVTYTPPSAVTSSFAVTVVATSVQDPTKSASVMLDVLTLACPAGSESMLKGQYAFLLRGADSGGPAAIAGSFAADGGGKIGGGSIDQNRVSTGPQAALSIHPAGSSYSVGSDQRGCLTLATSSGTMSLRFSLAALSGGIAGRGHLIEFDDATGTGTRAEGFMRRQDATAFSQAAVAGGYAFEFVGEDALSQHIATIGVLAADGAGGVANGQLDTNDAGQTAPAPSSATGSYGTIDANGRATMAVSVDGKAASDFVLYVASAQEILALSMDARSQATPLLSGELLQQTAGSFNEASLNARSVLWASGFIPGATGASVSIGALTPDGQGHYALVFDLNQAGAFYPLVQEQGTYAVAANGRATTTTTLGHPPFVMYLIEANRAFILSAGPE
ncbi:MAG TPA: hypothetical protein VLX90_15350, partial [Steroidobacteraceae bacterium]|nr:hypothetical protein [Steroidobacteraceae bacterium]